MGTLYNAKTTPQGWQQPLTGWINDLAAAGMRPASIKTRRRQIAFLARDSRIPTPREVTSEGLICWCAARPWQAETRRTNYSAFRSFFGWTSGDTDNPADALPAVHRDQGVPRPIPDDLWHEAIHHSDERTRLILQLAGRMGLRRTEISQIHTSDLLGGPSLLIDGKGGRKRIVPIPRGFVRELRGALDRADGWLFPGGHEGHLGAERIAELAHRALPQGWGLHTCRHRFATAVYSTCHDLLIVQQLLGHASVATTQRYTAIPDDAARQAVNLAA